MPGEPRTLPVRLGTRAATSTSTCLGIEDQAHGAITGADRVVKNCRPRWRASARTSTNWVQVSPTRSSRLQTGSLGATDSIKTFFQSMTGTRPGAGSSWRRSSTTASKPASPGPGDVPAALSCRALSARTVSSPSTSAGRWQASSTPLGLSDRRHVQTALAQYVWVQAARGIAHMVPVRRSPSSCNIARQAGAMIDLNNYPGTMTGNPASEPESARVHAGSPTRCSRCTRAMPLGQIGPSIGGFVANTAAQRQGAYLTGGAFSMIKSGGGAEVDQ